MAVSPSHTDQPSASAVLKFFPGTNNELQPEISALHDLLTAHPGRTLRTWSQSREGPLPSLLEWDAFDQNLRINAVFKPVDTELIEKLRANRRPPKDFSTVNDPALQQYIRLEANPFDAESIRALEELQAGLADSALPNIDSVVLSGTIGRPPEEPPTAQPFDHDNWVGTRHVHNKHQVYNGAFGENTWFVDVEQGWSLPHQELNGRCEETPISGVNRDWIWSPTLMTYDPVGWHGLMTLGLIAANRAGGPLTGIAPKSFGFLAAEWDKLAHTPYTINTAQAIKAAADLLDPGDVILIEGQRYFAQWECNLPVEADPAVYAAIRYAIERNITVIEPAGNNDINGPHEGGVKLDIFMQRNELKHMQIDSGAILVAAGNNSIESATFTRRAGSNYGSRVNCFADGDEVWALDPPYQSGSSTTSYYRVPNGGTSTAAAIIAGVALILQGIQRADGHIISPGKMRDLLTKANHGIAIQPNDPGQPFGVMPHLIMIETGKGGTLKNLGDVPI